MHQLRSIQLVTHEFLRDSIECPWLFIDQVLSWEGTNSQRAWRYLRISLDTYDSLDSDWSYHKIVFQKILDLDRFSRVPAWLVKFFEVSTGQNVNQITSLTPCIIGKSTRVPNSNVIEVRPGAACPHLQHRYGTTGRLHPISHSHWVIDC